MLEINGCIVAIDVMGTQKEIAENFNILRQTALSILKSEKGFKGSITDK